MTHYIIERLSWDTSGKEKETWKQCNKRDVEELSFVVEDLKEASLTEDSMPLSFFWQPDFLPLQTCPHVSVYLQGGEYEFRVKAVNAAGPSRPSTTAGPLVIKDQTCNQQLPNLSVSRLKMFLKYVHHSKTFTSFCSCSHH